MSAATGLRTTRHGRRPDADRGAVMTWVAIMIPALLVVAALVIDVGAMYVERRALQNGADAAALAVAQDCGNGNCGDEWGVANQYVGLNATGANADVVCGSDPAGGLAPCSDGAPSGAAGASGWVRVRSTNDVDFELMPGSRTITADAVAAWGPLGRGQGIPLIFSVCEFTALGGDLHGGTFPSGTAHIYFQGVGGGADPCTASPSGQDLPGGFGWLRPTPGLCEGTYTVGEWASVDTGASATQACRNTLPTLIGEEIVIVMFDDLQGQGSGGSYHVAGFAGFRLMGFRFPGLARPSGFRCPGQGNPTCVFGEFTRVTTSGGEFGGTDFGARVIRMVG